MNARAVVRHALLLSALSLHGFALAVPFAYVTNNRSGTVSVIDARPTPPFRWASGPPVWP